MGQRLRVALLQLRAFELSEHETAWSTLLRAIDEAAADRPDLILLPEAAYPAYFLYSRDAYHDAGVRPPAEIIATLAERAEQAGATIALGVALPALETAPAGNPALENVCLVIGPDGRLLVRQAKSFLWHFEARWFERGSDLPLFAVAGTPAGALFASDARLPEVARALAVGGARLLLVPSAAAARGRDRSDLHTPAIEASLRARAIENGAWVLVASRVGVEAGSLAYGGRSGVIDPRGEWVAQAPSDRPGIVTFALDPAAASGPPVARRPELYAAAGPAGAGAAALALAREPLVVEDAGARVAAVALDRAPSAVDVMERSRRLVRALALQDCGLVVLGDLAGADTRSVTQQEFLPLFADLAAEAGTMLAVVLAERGGPDTHKTAYLLDRGELVAAHRQTHLDAREVAAGFSPGSQAPPVVDSAIGQIGLIAGSEGLVPELPRSLKLRGAELLAWCAGPVDATLEVMARARAGENRLYVVVAGTSASAGGAYVVDPTGAVLAESLAGEQLAASAGINRALARWNDMAPHTNPIRDRGLEALTARFTPLTPAASD